MDGNSISQANKERISKLDTEKSANQYIKLGDISSAAPELNLIISESRQSDQRSKGMNLSVKLRRERDSLVRNNMRQPG